MKIPRNWGNIRFGELNQHTSRTIDPSIFPDELFELYSVPTFSTGKPEIQKGSAIGSTKQVVEPGDVLVCKINPRINRVWQVGAKKSLRQIASSEWIVMRAPQMDVRFLRDFFRSNNFRDFICQDVTGVGGSLTRAQPKRVATFHIPIAPLNEQKRIADKLDALLARVEVCREHLDRVPAILKRFRQAVLAMATTGKLTGDWREEREKANMKHTEWTHVALGELCENSFYGPRFGKNEYTTSDRGVPTIRTTDMTNAGRIDISEDTPRVLVPNDKTEHFRVRKGDLLVTRTGSIGVMAVFEDDYLAIPSAYLIRFRFSSRVLSRFVFYSLMSPYGQERLGLSTTAITQPNINAEAIKKIEIQLPSIDEQHEIIRRVESLYSYADRFEARYEKARARVERITHALLGKAFRGELVPQDPKDEPAKKLLVPCNSHNF